MPPFSFSTFGTLISEFQKYLSNRIPKAIYFSLGLVVVTLGIINGYLIGWSIIEKDWNATSAFYKIVLAAISTIVFFIVAYALGSIQGSVERLFQGEWPFRMGSWTFQHTWHRAIWQERNESWQKMSNLHDVIKAMYDQAIHWGQVRPQVVQTRHALPHYYVIGDQLDEDLMTTFVDTAPDTGTLQDLEAANGMMTQRLLAKETILTHADLIRLPDGFKDIKIVPITLLAKAVPAGLVPGDRISIYDGSNDPSSPNSLEDAVLVEVEHMSRPSSDKAPLDLVCLTLAVQSKHMSHFISLSNYTADNRLCAVLCPPETSNWPSIKTKDPMQNIDLPQCIKKILDDDERNGRKKIHFIWRKRPWLKLEDDALDWDDIEGDEELVVAFNCQVVEDGKQLRVPKQAVKRFQQENAMAQNSSIEVTGSHDPKTNHGPYIEKLHVLSLEVDGIPHGWGYWEAKKFVNTSISEELIPGSYFKYDGTSSWDAIFCSAAGFIMTKPEKESLDDYTPESYFGVTGLICQIETIQNTSQSKVTFLIGQDENRINEQLLIFDILLHTRLITNMKKLDSNIKSEPEHLSIQGDIAGARHFLIDMASTMVLLDLIRHPIEVSVAHDFDLHVWHDEIDVNRRKLMHILKKKLIEIEYKLDQRHKWFQLYYPASEPAIAPTAIGNVIRAVDSYCKNMYGLDTALVLPRLQAVMEKDTRSQLSAAHDQLALIEWMLLAITVIVGFGTLLAVSTLHYNFALMLWLLLVPGWFVLRKAALAAALDYATVLRLAFERERGKVINKLGFSLPKNLDEEKALWERVEQWWNYGKPPGNYTINSDSGGGNEKN